MVLYAIRKWLLAAGGWAAKHSLAAEEVVLQLGPRMDMTTIVRPLQRISMLHISVAVFAILLLLAMQVRDRQVISHLKAQLAQAQAYRKQPSKTGGRKAQAQVHMAMEKCLHMDRQLEM